MKIKKIVLAALVIFSLSSCNVYRTINFNADQSGTMENKVDMSSMMSLMNENGGGSNPMGSMGDLKELEKTKGDLSNVPGISNVQVNYDTTGIITTSYNFNSIEALNTALNSGFSSQNMMMGMGQEGQQGISNMKYKGKKFTWTEIDKKTLKKMQSGESKDQMAQMDMMLASSKMNTTITFPTAIKNVSYKNASITNDRTLNYEMSVKEFLSKDYKPLMVTLK
jgi:hypothetical protein